MADGNPRRQIHQVICQGFTGSEEIVPADNLADAVRKITDEVRKAA